MPKQANYRYSYELNEEEMQKVEYLKSKGIKQIDFILEGLDQAYNRAKLNEKES